MVSRSFRGAALALTLTTVSACQWILGFEDHELGSPEAGTGGGDAGAEGGNAGALPDSGPDVASGTPGMGGRPFDGGHSTSGGSAGDAAGGEGTSSGGSAGSAGSIVDAGDDEPNVDSGCVHCELRDALVHRYSFDGSGTDVLDSVGGAHGTVTNTTLAGTGQLDLQGQSSDQYVDLPNGIISALGDATFEAWITWNGGGAWQRIFDFGESTVNEGGQMSGRSYLFLTTQAQNASGPARVAYKGTPTSTEIVVNATRPVPPNTLTHVAVVVSTGGNRLSLYLDGVLEGLVSPMGALATINDVNNWLGRSQYRVDSEFGGTLHEFRIYDAALSEAQVAASFAEGPDPAFLAP